MLIISGILTGSITLKEHLTIFPKENFVTDSGMKILVMDDEDIVADIAKQMLMYMGHEVSIVENGEDAIQEFKQAREAGEPFALVIMDLNIPRGMGGVEAVKHVLDIDGSAKVLASTGYTSDAIMQDYQKYGFCGCIAKPFDLNSLKNALQAVWE